MYYYKARFYSYKLGRFLQTDPIGYEDQFNLYAYVANDPINNIDPSGLDTCENDPETGVFGCTESEENRIVVDGRRRNSQASSTPSSPVTAVQIEGGENCGVSTNGAINTVRGGLEFLSAVADGVSVVSAATGVGVGVGGLAKGAQFGIEAGLFGLNAYDAYVNGNSAPLVGQVSGGLARLAPGARAASHIARTIRKGPGGTRAINGQPRGKDGRFRRSRLESAGADEAVRRGQQHFTNNVVKGTVCALGG